MQTNGAMLSGMGGASKNLIARVWKEAAESVGLGTKEKVVVALLIQAMIAGGIFVSTQSWQADLWVRALTAAAPFTLFPLLFAWKWNTLPLRMAAEAAPPRAVYKVKLLAMYAEHQACFRRAYAAIDVQTLFASRDEVLQLLATSQKWLRETMGEAAFAKYLAPSGVNMSYEWSGYHPVGESQLREQLLNSLRARSDNLQAMLASDAWDPV